MLAAMPLRSSVGWFGCRRVDIRPGESDGGAKPRHHAALGGDGDQVLQSHDLAKRPRPFRESGRARERVRAFGGRLLGKQPVAEFADGEVRDGRERRGIVRIADQARDFVLFVRDDAARRGRPSTAHRPAPSARARAPRRWRRRCRPVRRPSAPETPSPAASRRFMSPRSRDARMARLLLGRQHQAMARPCRVIRDAQHKPHRRADHALVVIRIAEQDDQRQSRHRTRWPRRQCPADCDRAARCAGTARASRMNDAICRMYASTAPNTAMFSRTAPTGLPCGVRWIASATANPSAAPAISARCGVSRVRVSPRARWENSPRARANRSAGRTQR